MALFGRRDDAARTSALEQRVSLLERELEAIRRSIDNFRLDYEGLYEKVRVTLSKLRRRAESPQNDEPEPAKDPMARAREALLQRKLARKRG